jgi:light-regulated signal transduction histidine kinase (bacteriophytochrome)
MDKRIKSDELIMTDKELAFQNKEKEKRADELIIANKELAFQDSEKEKRADELIIANKELAFQNREKEKRADELMIANKELAFQNKEKEKRADELMIANKELAFQNKEKEKRAAELIIANKKLAFQNREKEKRAAELMIANKELEQFTYIASHDLREPLRTVSNYMKVFEEDYSELLDDNGHRYLHSVNNATKRMSQLIKSLLDFSRLGHNINLTLVDCKTLIYDVIADLETMIKTSNAVIEVEQMPILKLYETEIRQVFQNLITNSIKFHKKDTPPKIQIRSEKLNEKWKFAVCDNGIGIAPEHFERVFDIFQRLHINEEEYEGNGIGLANCKKIIQLHQGEIWIESNIEQGTTLYFTIPILKV